MSDRPVSRDPVVLPDRYRDALEPYGDFPVLLEALLFDADPVGLNYETNTDESRPEAQTIALRLPTASSAEDVLRIMHEDCWSDGPLRGRRDGDLGPLALERWISK